jgi:drug/metabolite transporter (DMT)-like permease
VVWTVGLALAGAAIYGVADFLGGIASRRARPVLVTALAAAVGLVPLLIGLAILGGSFSGGAVVGGIVAGISGSVGVLLLYAALAVGPMSVLSPVTAVVAAAVPVLVAVVRGAALSALTIAALGVAMVAVVLVATVRDTSGAPLTRRGLLAAIVAGCGFGALVLAYEQAPPDGLGTLVVARALQTVLMTVAAVSTTLWLRRRLPRNPIADAPPTPADRVARFRGRRTFALLVVACGMCDAAANVLIQAALHASDDPTTLPIVGVLNALYPVGTIILAAIVLRERLSRTQVAGLVLAIAASVGMTLG